MVILTDENFDPQFSTGATRWSATIHWWETEQTHSEKDHARCCPCAKISQNEKGGQGNTTNSPRGIIYVPCKF